MLRPAVLIFAEGSPSPILSVFLILSTPDDKHNLTLFPWCFVFPFLSVFSAPAYVGAEVSVRNFYSNWICSRKQTVEDPTL